MGTGGSAERDRRPITMSRAARPRYAQEPLHTPTGRHVTSTSRNVKKNRQNGWAMAMMTMMTMNTAGISFANR